MATIAQDLPFELTHKQAERTRKLLLAALDGEMSHDQRGQGEQTWIARFRIPPGPREHHDFAS